LRENMPPKVITITNQKGGTGKTTLTALLGYELASRGYNVLFLDLDPQAHLSSFFIPISELENITDGVIEIVHHSRFKIREVNLGTKGRIGIVPSGLNYMISTYRGMIPTWDPLVIDVRIKTEPSISKTYDFILCDTPPGLLPPTVWGLYAADYVLIPTNYEELSFTSIKLLVKYMLPDIITKSKRDLKVLGLVMTNVAEKITSETIDRLNESFVEFLHQLPNTLRERFYKRPLFDSVVYRYQELRDLMYRSREEQIPLSRVIDRSPDLKQNLDALYREFIERIERFEGLK